MALFGGGGGVEPRFDDGLDISGGLPFFADDEDIGVVVLAGGLGGGGGVAEGCAYVWKAVGDDTLEKGDIVIGGTVFGGGEANASGSEIYDFSFISVTT